MAAPTSGTYNWAPTSGELILFCFAEAGVKRAEIETEHLVNARICANNIFSDWSGDQPHLWQVELISIPLMQGVATYQLPPNTILVLDSYLRTFQLPVVFNVAPNFSTVINTPTVTVGLTNHGFSPGSWVNFLVPVSVGGLIVQGYYQIATVPNGNAFTITAGSNAASTITSGGVVPYFTTAALSSNVTVSFPNHGQQSGFEWNLQVATPVGGTTLQGAYTVETVIDANNFTISAQQEASSAASAYENNAQAYIAGSPPTGQVFNDRILWPIGRSEYATYPNKYYASPPTVQWFDRLVAPQITTYPVADGNGPYSLQLYTVRQPQDVNPTFAETPDIPYRFNAAFSAELSLALAQIYGPERIDRLEKRRDRLLGRAQAGDVEHVPLYIAPQFGSYRTRR